MKFHPRFTVRTLAIFVTLVGAYFAAWEATKRHAEYESVTLVIKSESVTSFVRPDITSFKQGQMDQGPEHIDVMSIVGASSPFPLVLVREELNGRIWPGRDRRRHELLGPPVKRYYLWLFGPKVKLPFDEEWSKESFNAHIWPRVRYYRYE